MKYTLKRINIPTTGDMVTCVTLDCTSEERVVLEVLNAVLAQSVLSTANEPTNQILCVLRHVCYLLRELETLLCKRCEGIHERCRR